MSFRPCFLIPHYNHMHALPQTVAGLRRFGAPIIIIDDGSRSEDKAALQSLSHEQPDLIVHWRAHNGGKGCAMSDGLKVAIASGMTHAFQIDADGQHDQSVIPQFLQAAEREPTALIAGQPLYDASAPKSRLYGRRITDFWVAIETLSLQIGDAMCGFRIYPLTACAALQQSRRLLPRMDFDTDILVRLHWMGVPLRFLPCRVIYPEQGVSHFKLWADNWRISKMHARLVCGMLWRLPMLLWRKCR